MDVSGIALLLLACCLFEPTLARYLDITQRSFEQSEDASRDLALKKQGPMLLFAETEHADGLSVSSSFLHEAGHDSNLHLIADLFLHDDDDSIASLLQQNGLPVGLLPSSVANYSITDDGEFTVSLDKACYVKFDYEVYYAETITGKLSYGTITDLSGIQAKEAFFWVAVTGIRTDIPSSDYIYFTVGPISKKLSISQFETIPVCNAKAMALRALV